MPLGSPCERFSKICERVASRSWSILTLGDIKWKRTLPLAQANSYSALNISLPSMSQLWFIRRSPNIAAIDNGKTCQRHSTDNQ
jgi:hypothetical protein